MWGRGGGKGPGWAGGPSCPVDPGTRAGRVAARQGFEIIPWATDCNWEIPAEDGRS